MARGTEHPDDLKVLRFREWIALAGVSPATGKRILKSGSGPRIVKLSERRIGITLGAHRRWVERSARSA